MDAKKVSVAILFLFCLSCFIPSVFGQNRSTVTGYVFDSQRSPVAQIPVELMNDVNSVLQRTKTDGSGRFVFRGLSSGRFSVRVLPIGTDLQEQSQDVEIFGVGARGRPLSDNIQIDFYLRPKKTTANSAAVNDVIFAQEIPLEARKLYEKAVTDLEDKRIEQGIISLQQALGLFPTYYLALERLGAVYINQQKYENARDVFSKAVSVNSRSFNCWYGLSYVNYTLRQPEAAIEAARKAISINSRSSDALLFLGLSLRQAKNYEEAEKSLKQADKLTERKSPDIHWNLALLYAHNLKRYGDAADELELYLKTSPDTPNTENIKKLIKQFRENSTAKKD
jgi:Flp pilus assembly protein TadD